MNNKKTLVNFYLFSEMDEADSVTAIQYELASYELEEMNYSIEGRSAFVKVGDTFHHKDDIIRIKILRDDIINFG
jgi:hypothetical protein